MPNSKASTARRKGKKHKVVLENIVRSASYQALLDRAYDDFIQFLGRDRHPTLATLLLQKAELVRILKIHIQGLYDLGRPRNCASHILLSLQHRHPALKKGFQALLGLGFCLAFRQA